MTDDLVKRLRETERQYVDNKYNLYARAASRIEQLEAALTTIGYGPPDEGNTLTILNEFVDIARAALGEKKDD
jgi:hypothetical protein